MKMITSKDQLIVTKAERRGGYSILEVIIAMAVLAVLMSMLMPVLALAKNRARRLKCQNNVKQINVTFIAFASENEVKFPWLIVDVDKKALGIAGGIHQTAGQVPPAAAIPRRPDVHAPPFYGR